MLYRIQRRLLLDAIEAKTALINYALASGDSGLANRLDLDRDILLDQARELMQ